METEPKIIADYVNTGKAKLVFHHITDFQPSQKASEAAECAGAQGQFWIMHGQLYRHQDDLFNDVTTTSKKLAADIGLNMGTFNQCFDAGQFAAKVKADNQSAKASGIRTRPSFLLNGKKVEGAVPYTVFKGLLDQALQ